MATGSSAAELPSNEWEMVVRSFQTRIPGRSSLYWIGLRNGAIAEETCAEREPCERRPIMAAQGSKAAPGELSHLIRRLNKGDSSAVALAFEMRNGLDGGDLEDLTRALGSVVNEYPKLFLQEARKRSLSDHELGQIVAALPLEHVDHIARQLGLLKRRMKSLESVTDPELMAIREMALAALRADVRLLEPHAPKK